mgnify:CR=1 FL=1
MKSKFKVLSDILDNRKESQLDEVSMDLLARYKIKAAEDASKSDRSGNYIKGDKRTYGIGRATKKEFIKNLTLKEELKVSDGMKQWIKDFQDSDAPQFDEKDDEERRNMAIAAFLSAKKKES